MSDLSGSAKCVKYTLFVFNLLFLLAGLALIIVGAVVQVQTSKASSGDSQWGGNLHHRHWIRRLPRLLLRLCWSDQQ